MTSGRSENISTFQYRGNEAWCPPITAFTDTGGSLRSIPGHNALNMSDFSAASEKDSSQQSFKNSSAGTYTNSRGKECGLINACPNVFMTNNANAINRELSPVRWCDRKVDGVYLGKSGWVQVQQRSLDDSKGVFYSENICLPNLSSRKYFSDLDSNPECSDKKREWNKSLNLPLSVKKRSVRGNCERPYKFIEELESISPPSVTPIISPPPAFKDDGLNVEFSRQLLRKPFYSEESFVLGSGNDTSLESFHHPTKVRQSTLQVSPSPVSTGSTASSYSTSKHEAFPYRTLKTKSLEEDCSSRIRCDGRPNASGTLSSLGFRSLDNDLEPAGCCAIKISGSDFNYRNLKSPKEKGVCNGRDREENFERNDDSDEEKSPKGHFLRLQDSPKEGFDGFAKNLTKASRQRNSHRGGRRTCNSYKSRSSSTDSSSSSSSSTGSSFGGKSSAKPSSLRRTGSKEKQNFELENSSRDLKNFYVKRSRSLQLSEKKTPNESPMMNHCVSGKSWDPMPPEYSSLRKKNQRERIDGENFSKFPQPSHHFLVTVNGDSIPVSTSGNQIFKSLDKITGSEKKQRKLIMEAEKEARIISEFLNGTRSRAAARNLLMHRYLSGHSNSMESKECTPQKPEHNAHFSENNPMYQNKQSVCGVNYTEENFFKDNKSISSNSSKRGSTSAYSKHSNFNTTSQSRRVPSQDFDSLRKKDRIENKSQFGRDRRTETKSQNLSGFSNEECSNSTGNTRLPVPNNNTLGKGLEEHESNVKCMKSFLQNSSRVIPLHKVPGEQGQSGHGSSPSSSVDIYDVDLNSKLRKSSIIMKPSSFLEEESKKPLEMFDFRPGRASESEDSISPEPDHRSLSLPRSFLSERYKPVSDQRELREFRMKQLDLETVNRSESELVEHLKCSRTAPTTPTRDSKCDKSSDNLDEIHYDRPPDLSSEYSSLKPRQFARKVTQEEPKCFERSLNEENEFLIYRRPWKIDDNLLKVVVKNLKKKIPLKYAEDLNVRIKEDADNESIANSNETIQNECYSTPPENEVQVLGKGVRLSKNEKYDSHDSGIQMGYRGNVDSSESQDTDLQEDFDSPLLVRRRDILKRKKIFNPQFKISNHIITDRSKADNEWLNSIKKDKCGRIVRRTNSDLDTGEISDLHVKRHSTRFGLRGRHENIIWEVQSNEDKEKLSGFMKAQLRRSLSQPSGLNELQPFSERSSKMKYLAFSEDEKNPHGKNSEDEFMSGSESSIASLRETKKNPDFTPRDETAILAEALWDHVAIESCELPFKAGDVIEVLDTQNWDWWWGATAENRGYFPSAFVRLRVNQEDTVEDCLAAMSKGKRTSIRLRRGKSVSLLSNDQVRSSVVKELLSTERDFVKNLRDVKDGYIEQCKRRTDMFSPEQIIAIFGNLEDILSFQENFLKDLETKVDKELPYKSCIGEVFLTHGWGFRMYSEYCNSHPMAIATLQDLYRKDNYCQFLETCRLKKNLIEIPLDGYLLTPVQRICKYPLQLAELLKYTKPDHPDFKEVGEALETMRRVATLINERKRRMESLEKLAAWQQRVEGWMGEDLIERSSQLIHQGDVIRITSGMWTTNITLFLFDHQIVYCKRDLLKKSVYVYKGRIFLDESFIVDVPDGKNQQLGVSIKYGLKICNNLKDKWLLFCCRSSEDKAKWLDAFAEEKKLVAQDKEVDLNLPPAAKQLAKMAARTKKKCPPCKPKHKTKILPNHEEVSFRNCQSNTSKSKASRRMGMWFTFGGVMKSPKTGNRPQASLQRIT